MSSLPSIDSGGFQSFFLVGKTCYVGEDQDHSSQKIDKILVLGPHRFPHLSLWKHKSQSCYTTCEDPETLLTNICIMNLGTNYSGPHARTPMKTANIRKKWLLTGWLLGEFIACVQNHFVFETCVSRCKIRISPDGGFFKLLGHRWYMPPAFHVCWECLKIVRRLLIYWKIQYVIICIYNSYIHTLSSPIISVCSLWKEACSTGRLSKASLVVGHNVKWQAAIGVASTRQIVIWPP